MWVSFSRDPIGSHHFESMGMSVCASGSGQWHVLLLPCKLLTKRACDLVESRTSHSFSPSHSLWVSLSREWDRAIEKTLRATYKAYWCHYQLAVCMHKGIHKLGTPESQNTYIVSTHACVYVLWPIYGSLFIIKWASLFWLTSQNHAKMTEVSPGFEGRVIAIHILT